MNCSCRGVTRERTTATAPGLSLSGVYLGLPHRLDRSVSGVILLAKTRRAARKLSRQFERRTVHKTYWACVAGVVDPAEGTWVDFMRKIPDEPRSETVPESHPEAQEAVLHYRVLGETRHGSWLEIDLETGRMHQIRLQAAVHGNPIVGDALYGSELSLGPAPAVDRLRAIALHARSISFDHPQTHERLTITAPLPEVWSKLRLSGEWRVESGE